MQFILTPVTAILPGNVVKSLMTHEELEFNYDVSGPYTVTRVIHDSAGITIHTASECGSTILRTFAGTDAAIYAL